ncbi:hypothetical protein LTR62_007875 [Meristemomyces frigidus]|uniref:Uncharacterized protein n=1 Tax=Meristemomyces frigidus TaxID=1508187 RepID=A0AAN7TBA2_9PEZI|nr:hypothetical protein LTR62_007875 [Meristemomyces frigidus]
MSQDLLSAFGAVGDEQDSFPRVRQAGNTAGHEHELIGVAGTSPEPEIGAVDDDDDFGDFEDASAANPVPLAKASRPVVDEAYGMGTQVLAQPTYPPPKHTATPTRKAPKVVSGPLKPTAEIGSHPFAGRMDFLFEADDDEYNAGTDEIGDIASNPEAAMAYSKRVILEQQAREEAKKQAELFPKQAVPVRRELVRSPEAKMSGSQVKGDVLFDAETETAPSEDGWGDEEVWHTVTAQQALPQPKALAAMDLLSLDEVSNDGLALQSERTNTPIRPMTEYARTLHHQNMIARRPSPVLVQDVAGEDNDEWDDFEEAPTTSTASAVPSITSRIVSVTAIQHSKSPKRNPLPHLPPPNIPPPSVLLSLFPALLSPPLNPNPNSLHTLLSHATALAHIIAGRKLRWKRDVHLSQSMRIGPSASSGGSGKGGMKLTGVDRGEIAKEDREVLECLRVWKGQVGKLRSAVAAANAALPARQGWLPAVPELAEQLTIRTLKVSEGGFTAPAACALCGLRREERVVKVDVAVEDSFGEWWIEGANMHVVCAEFWGEYEGRLRGR